MKIPDFNQLFDFKNRLTYRGLFQVDHPVHRNQWLMDALHDHDDFCYGMVSLLVIKSLSENNFTDVQLDVMAGLYAKTKGRKGSSKFRKAIEYFWDEVANNNLKEEQGRMYNEGTDC